MKNPVTLAVLLILTPAFDFVQAAATATQEDKHAEEEIRRLNGEELDAFLHKDPQAMARLWSDDFVVTNPLNKFVTKQQVPGMVESGFLVITSFDREIEYLRVYGDIVIVCGRRDRRLGREDAERRENRKAPLYRSLDETSWKVAGDRAPRQHCSCSAARQFRLKSQPAHSAFNNFVRQLI